MSIGRQAQSRKQRHVPARPAANLSGELSPQVRGIRIDWILSRVYPRRCGGEAGKQEPVPGHDDSRTSLPRTRGETTFRRCTPALKRLFSTARESARLAVQHTHGRNQTKPSPRTSSRRQTLTGPLPPVPAGAAAACRSRRPGAGRFRAGATPRIPPDHAPRASRGSWRRGPPALSHRARPAHG